MCWFFFFIIPPVSHRGLWQLCFNCLLHYILAVFITPVPRVYLIWIYHTCFLPMSITPVFICVLPAFTGYDAKPHVLLAFWCEFLGLPPLVIGCVCDVQNVAISKWQTTTWQTAVLGRVVVKQRPAWIDNKFISTISNVCVAYVKHYRVKFKKETM